MFGRASFIRPFPQRIMPRPRVRKAKPQEYKNFNELLEEQKKNILDKGLEFLKMRFVYVVLQKLRVHQGQRRRGLWQKVRDLHQSGMLKCVDKINNVQGFNESPRGASSSRTASSVRLDGNLNDCLETFNNMSPAMLLGAVREISRNPEGPLLESFSRAASTAGSNSYFRVEDSGIPIEHVEWDQVRAWGTADSSTAVSRKFCKMLEAVEAHVTAPPPFEGPVIEIAVQKVCGLSKKNARQLSEYIDVGVPEETDYEFGIFSPCDGSTEEHVESPATMQPVNTATSIVTPSEKPHFLICPMCKNSFATKTNMKRHCKNIHDFDPTKYLKKKEVRLKRIANANRPKMAKKPAKTGKKGAESKKESGKKRKKNFDQGKQLGKANAATPSRAAKKARKIFKCKICAKIKKKTAYTRNEQLQAHIANKHKKQRVLCPWCDKSYTDKSNMKRHCLAVHRKRPTRKQIDQVKRPYVTKHFGDFDFV